MDRDNIRQAVINALVATHKSTGGFLDTQPVAAALGVPFDSVRSVVGELAQRNLVLTFVGEEQAQLTDMGIDRLVDDDPAAPRGGDVNVVVNGGIHAQNSAVAVGRATASVTNRQMALLQSLAQQVGQHPDIPPQDRASLLAKIRDLSAHPVVVTILGKLLGS